MALRISNQLLAQIRTHGELTYPEEGVGFLLGRSSDEQREVSQVLPAANARETTARATRYEISVEETLAAEETARNLKLEIIGIFHSHPDHLAYPSGSDQESAIPWFTYVITGIAKGKAGESRAWRLSEDGLRFAEETIVAE